MEIIPLICTSVIRASILSFHSLWDSPLEVTAFTDDCGFLLLTTDSSEVPPKEKKGEYQDMIKVRAYTFHNAYTQFTKVCG